MIYADILNDTLPQGTFDLVTVIGSTVSEVGDYECCLDSCQLLLRPGGHLMFMDFAPSPSSRFDTSASGRDIEIVERRDDAIARAYAFWLQRKG